MREMLDKPERMNEFYAWVKAKPEYPNLQYGQSILEFMREVLKLPIGITENTMSQ